MPKKRIGVLGGGASGMMAAISAAMEGADVTILEHKDRVGKKILMTGNGKCNLTNLHIDDSFYYSHDLAYAMDILNAFGPQKAIDEFHKMGLWTKEKRDGGIYPVAEQAAVVLDELMSACDRLGVKTILNCNIEEILPGKQIGVTGYLNIPEEVASSIKAEKFTKTGKEKKAKKPELIYHKQKYTAKFDALILACGSKAAPVTGSDGSGYEFASRLGLHLYPTSPALVQLHADGNFLKALAGVRVEASILLEVDGKHVAEEYGEVQLTDYGISGIPVFQVSRIATQAFLKHSQCVAVLDFFPYHQDPLPWNSFPDKTVECFLEGFVNKKLAGVMLKLAGCQFEQKVSSLSEKTIRQLEKLLHHFDMVLTKSNPFENAQVCAGGVDLQEVNQNLSCKKYENIYIVGELLDVDGKCGGYNLQWAWTTGYIAGKAAALYK